jgi:anti-sigma factor RsiW
MNDWGDNPMMPGSGAAAGASGHIDEWAALAVDLVDGTVDEAERATIETHLAWCPDCAARLASQRELSSLLRDVEMVAPPTYLEDQVLGELLFPSRVLENESPQPVGSRRTSLWERRLRPWMPATVAVAAVFIGLIAWGVFNPTESEQTTARSGDVTTVAAAATDSAGAAADSVAESAVLATPMETALGQTETTAAPASEDATTTAGASVTMVATGAGDGTEPVPTTIQDRKAMVTALKETTGPVYLSFSAEPDGTEGSAPGSDATTDGDSAGMDSAEPSPTGTAADSEDIADATAAGWMQEVVSQMTTFTELKPLPTSLSPDRPVFAAFLDHDNVSAFVDLLRSIGASLGLVVSLQREPDVDCAEIASVITQNKKDLPVLVGYVIPQPAPYRYGFTTSTVDEEMDQKRADGSPLTMPDEAGTHVLTILFMRP